MVLLKDKAGATLLSENGLTWEEKKKKFQT